MFRARRDWASVISIASSAHSPLYSRTTANDFSSGLKAILPYLEKAPSSPNSDSDVCRSHPSGAPSVESGGPEKGAQSRETFQTTREALSPSATEAAKRAPAPDH